MFDPNREESVNQYSLQFRVGMASKWATTTWPRGDGHIETYYDLPICQQRLVEAGIAESFSKMAALGGKEHKVRFSKSLEKTLISLRAKVVALQISWAQRRTLNLNFDMALTRSIFERVAAVHNEMVYRAQINHAVSYVKGPCIKTAWDFMETTPWTKDKDVQIRFDSLHNAIVLQKEVAVKSGFYGHDHEYGNMIGSLSKKVAASEAKLAAKAPLSELVSSVTKMAKVMAEQSKVGSKDIAIRRGTVGLMECSQLLKNQGDGVGAAVILRVVEDEAYSEEKAKVVLVLDDLIENDGNGCMEIVKKVRRICVDIINNN